MGASGGPPLFLYLDFGWVIVKQTCLSVGNPGPTRCHCCLPMSLSQALLGHGVYFKLFLLDCFTSGGHPLH